jgi:N-acetylmuramoyl-L-alanine amidase
VLAQAQRTRRTEPLHVPKVFIETVNMTNPTDAAHLERTAFRQRAAAGVADGIER